jgi:hypothetical protein
MSLLLVLGRERAALMAEVMPGQAGADGGGNVLKLPPVDGPCWTGDGLVISRKWVAFTKTTPQASWSVIPYAAISSVRRGGSGSIVLSRPDGLAVAISAAALDSPEAYTLLADGLSTNPAVAPAAGKLLRSRVAAARSRRDRSLARRHKVDRFGATHRFYVMRGFHVVTGVIGAAMGVGLLIGAAVAVADPSSYWAQGISTWGAIWGTALSLLFVWLGIRLLRAGVQISAEKITIRGYFVTRTVNASEIHAITLQPKDNGEGQLRWIPRVGLTSGKGLWIASFDCGPARKPPKPELAATIEEVRTLLGVKAPDLGSQPELRHPDGSERPPVRQADPARGGAEKGKAPSPRAVSPQQWDDAAAKARWATIGLVIALVATVAGTAVLVAGYNPDGNSPTDWTVSFTILGPVVAWLAWRSRNEYRKLDRARRVAAELADARDSTTSPNDDRGEHPTG